MKKIIVTMKRLRATVARVEREIKALGLWHPNMQDTQVYLIPVHWYYGYTEAHDGNIYIPRLSLGRLSELVLGLPLWSLLGILRHEYSHARVFHCPETLNGWPEDDDRVSAYAATNINEDFAETFRFYLKHKGKLPKKWQGRDGILARWQCLQALTAICSLYFPY